MRAVSSTGELSPWSIEVNFTVTATAPTIHSPETDLQLTGLLASALDRPGDRDTKWSRMLAVKHPQTAVTAHVLDFEEAIAIQMQPSTKLVRPDTHVQKLNILDLDRLMEEFALLELKTTAIPRP